MIGGPRGLTPNVWTGHPPKRRIASALRLHGPFGSLPATPTGRGLSQGDAWLLLFSSLSRSPVFPFGLWSDRGLAGPLTPRGHSWVPHFGRLATRSPHASLTRELLPCGPPVATRPDHVRTTPYSRLRSTSRAHRRRRGHKHTYTLSFPARAHAHSVSISRTE